MVRIRVDNRVRVPLVADLPADVVELLKQDHTHVNPELAAKRAIKVTTYGVPSHIETWRTEGGCLTLPRGGMGRVRERLRAAEVEFEVEDARSEGVPCMRFPRYRGHTMRWYQEAAIEAAIRREQCIIRAPTGSGKTSVALALVERIGLNALIILPTGGLFKQWADRAREAFGLREDDLGVVQGQTRRLRPITIAMQQTLARGIPEEVREFFGVVLIDEAQLASARTYVEVVDSLACRYRIAVSADERRKDRKEFLAYDLFSDVAHEVKRRELEDEGHVLDVEIRVIPTDFRADWYGLDAGEGQEVDFNRLLAEMTADKARNKLATDAVLAEVEEGEQAIILTARREHARVLEIPFVERGISSGYLLGDQVKGDEEEFERTRSGIVDGSVRVGLGTYGALGFGIDLPAVSVGLAATPIAGNDQVTNQVRGRLCRPNPKAGKKGGRLLYLWDHHVYPRHLEKLAAKNRSVVVRVGSRWVPVDEYLGRNPKGRSRGRRGRKFSEPRDREAP